MAEPFLSEIRVFSFGFAPRGWALCNGQLLPINQNQALFSLLGTTYGGDGRVNFALPDLRGRVPIHTGNGHTLGERAGEQAHTLSMAEMPAHSHTLTGTVPSTTAVGNQTQPDGHLPAKANDGESNYSDAAATGGIALTGTTASQGGGLSHDNMPPFLAINFVIALAGLFPSRS